LGFIVLNVIDKMFLRSLINICLGFQENYIILFCFRSIDKQVGLYYSFSLLKKIDKTFFKLFLEPVIHFFHHFQIIYLNISFRIIVLSISQSIRAFYLPVSLCFISIIITSSSCIHDC